MNSRNTGAQYNAIGLVSAAKPSESIDIAGFLARSRYTDVMKRNAKSVSDIRSPLQNIDIGSNAIRRPTETAIGYESLMFLAMLYESIAITAPRNACASAIVSNGRFN